MSKFIDRLKKTSQEPSQPMGFGIARALPDRQKILLVAWLALENGIPEGAFSGADAALLQVSKISAATKALKGITQNVPDVPFGAWLKEPSQDNVKQLAAAGCDFLVFSTTASMVALKNDSVGKILEIEPTLAEGLLRSVNGLAVDAVLITGQSIGNVTWQDLMLFKYLGDLISKPLLLPVPADITGDELQALWQAGVAGVLVKFDSEKPDALKQLRAIIDKQVFPSRRKRRKMEAILPHVKEETPTPTEEEEEEEEE